MAGKGYAGLIPVKFHHVALAGNPQGPGLYMHTPGNQHTAPGFLQGAVVGIFMHQGTIHRAEILRPLVFHMN